ncbi:MAG: tail fiber domain-containing protein [Verrucomicrobiota bacterium]
MKTMPTFGFCAVLLLAFGFSATAYAQTTAFTYQGQLWTNTLPASGSNDLRFVLFDDPAAGSQISTNITVDDVVMTNGLFTVTLDWGGAAQFDGSDRWLEIRVRPGSATGPFTTLSPRQKITATPYAQRAASAGVAATAASATNLTGTLAATQLTGTIADARLSANVSLLGNNIDTTEIVNGTIANVDIDPAANIADTKLATINAAGKVANSATTATSANSPNAIVARDASGNFSAGTISGTFAGNGAAVTSLNAGQLASGTVPDARLSANVSLLGNNIDTTEIVNGTIANVDIDPAANIADTKLATINAAGKVANSATTATSANSPNAIVSRDASGNFSAGTITANFAGNGAGLTNLTVPTTLVSNNTLTVESILAGTSNVLDATYSSIGGGFQNVIDDFAETSAIGGGNSNSIIASSDSVIGGGYGNSVSYSSASQIGGGNLNTISLSSAATIGGGTGNEIYNSDVAFIGSGDGNKITNAANYTVIAGGGANTILDAAFYGAIGGGVGNQIYKFGQFGVIPGGYQNRATNYCFAAGYRANALHTGSFVWADNSTILFLNSVATNSVTMRAAGGYRLFSNSGLTAGVSLAPGDTSWAVISDRNAKKDFAAIDAVGILEKLSALPITQWRYNWEAGETTPHIGPMAQDFKHAFYPGADDKTITTLEADGVAFAAIQGLNRKLEAQQTELKQKERQLRELQQQLAELRHMVQTLTRDGQTVHLK